MDYFCQLMLCPQPHEEYHGLARQSMCEFKNEEGLRAPKQSTHPVKQTTLIEDVNELNR